jgi:hypothetical protein
MEHPADGVQGSPVKERDEKSGKDRSKGYKTNFYLVAVPSYFERGLLKYHVYQLISNYETTSDESRTRGENILMFNYEFSPITESVKKNDRSLVDFLV